MLRKLDGQGFSIICGHESQSVRTSRSLHFERLCCSPLWYMSDIRPLHIHKQGLSSSSSRGCTDMPPCRLQCPGPSSGFVLSNALQSKLTVRIVVVSFVYGRHFCPVRCSSRKPLSRSRANTVHCKPQTSVRVSHRLLFTQAQKSTDF